MVWGVLLNKHHAVGMQQQLLPLRGVYRSQAQQQLPMVPVHSLAPTSTPASLLQHLQQENQLLMLVNMPTKAPALVRPTSQQ
jgi:hypothetical protein